MTSAPMSPAVADFVLTTDLTVRQHFYGRAPAFPAASLSAPQHRLLRKNAGSCERPNVPILPGRTGGADLVRVVILEWLLWDPAPATIARCRDKEG